MSAEEISKETADILKQRTIDKALYVYSKACLQDRLNHLKTIFPLSTNHAVAIKSNSHPMVLKQIVNEDCGLEAASIEEVRLAVEAGCPHDKIVFDSPVKTVSEIDECNINYPEMIINANCFEELERLQHSSNVRVGIRINPLVDIGSPGIYDVSSHQSKFGIPIDSKEEIIVKAVEMDNVRGLHIHAGSEIGSRDNHIKAIASVVEIAEDIRAAGKKLEFVDIGGGISANVEGLEVFYKQLIDACPEILDYQIITEYGRFVQTHCAFVVSKVEYVLEHCTPEIALLHVGADLFPREIYSSAPPKHEYFVLDSNGLMKDKPTQTYALGGPLCFSGDFLERNIELPKIVSGDYVIISDTGANSLSMWSRHCSREVVEFTMV